MNEKLVKLLEEAEKTIGLLMLEVNRLNNEIKLRDATKCYEADFVKDAKLRLKAGEE